MARKANGAARMKFGGGRDSGGQMTPIADLQHDIVVCTIGSPPLEATVHVQRFRSGQVGMSCSCPDSAAHGWCQHRVDLLCKNYKDISSPNTSTHEDLDRIIGGTLLEEDGLRMAALLATFNESLAAFDEGRPANIAGENLATFTELVSDLAALSADLEDAIGRLRRRFEVGAGLIKRSTPRIAEPA